MKNPFVKKQDNTALLIAGIIAGAVAVGVGAWFYFKDQSEAENEPAEENSSATDYLHAKEPKLKKHKTDVHELHHVA